MACKQSDESCDEYALDTLVENYTLKFIVEKMSNSSEASTERSHVSNQSSGSFSCEDDDDDDDDEDDFLDEYSAVYEVKETCVRMWEGRTYTLEAGILISVVEKIDVSWRGFEDDCPAHFHRGKPVVRLENDRGFVGLEYLRRVQGIHSERVY